MKKKKGFTLIELLVVIAIIGILAAIVLVSLRGAPDKAKNARIQSALNQARTQAEMLYIEGGATGYVGLCDTGDDTLTETGSLGILEDDIAEELGATDLTLPTYLTCFESASSYCLSVDLLGTAGWFCVDDDGHATEVSANPCTVDADDTCE